MSEDKAVAIQKESESLQLCWNTLDPGLGFCIIAYCDGFFLSFVVHNDTIDGLRTPCWAENPDACSAFYFIGQFSMGSWRLPSYSFKMEQVY